MPDNPQPADRSAIVNALAEAIAASQNLKPDAVNPAFRKNGKGGGYITLGAVLDCIRPILAKRKLALTQFTYSTEGRVGVRTDVIGLGATFTVSDVTIRVPDGATIQAVGSAISYLRRQSIFSSMGIAPDGNDFDDDGNAASGADAGKGSW